MTATACVRQDALGSHTPHVAEESEAKHTTRETWGATLSTFFFKFVFALTFIVPVLLLKLPTAIIASVIRGLLILGFFSSNLAREQKRKPWKVIIEHIIITLAVLCIAHLVGDWISQTFVE